MQKHAAGLAQVGVDFIPFVLTTLGGVGPPAFREFIRTAYAGLAAKLIASGATGRDAELALSDLMQTLQASIARSNYIAVDRHTTDF